MEGGGQTQNNCGFEGVWEGAPKGFRKGGRQGSGALSPGLGFGSVGFGIQV